MRLGTEAGPRAVAPGGRRPQHAGPRAVPRGGGAGQVDPRAEPARLPPGAGRFVGWAHAARGSPHRRRDRLVRPRLLGAAVGHPGGGVRHPATGASPGLLRGTARAGTPPIPPFPLGPGYRAVTRYADIAKVSRNPEIYRSGQGPASIVDLPPEMVEYFAGMIPTHNPRHARLRRIVSAPPSAPAWCAASRTASNRWPLPGPRPDRRAPAVGATWSPRWRLTSRSRSSVT